MTFLKASHQLERQQNKVNRGLWTPSLLQGGNRQRRLLTRTQSQLSFGRMTGTPEPRAPRTEPRVTDESSQEEGQSTNPGANNTFLVGFQNCYGPLTVFCTLLPPSRALRHLSTIPPGCVESRQGTFSVHGVQQTPRALSQTLTLFT